MTRDELIRGVALHMDEITPDNDYVIAVDGSDNNPLYALIDGLIWGTSLELYSIAPYWRIKQKSFASVDTETAFANTDYERTVIRLKVPEDFLRVAEISHTDFARPITEVFSEQSEEGKRQHSPYLVAKTARPVGIMSHGVWGTGQSTEQVREIDCYSLGEGITFSAADLVATYIPTPEIIANTGTDAVEAVIPAALIPAFEWLLAARAFGSRGDVNHMNICEKNAKELLV